jgi:hypothetical protein
MISSDLTYSASVMPTKNRDLAVVEHLSRYLDRLFERLEERVEGRVVKRVEATLDVLTDPALMADLRRADTQPDSEARPFEEIRRRARAGRA